MKIKRIVEFLKEAYGAPEWHTDGDPVSVLIQTILSQNTSDTNSGNAFRSLMGAFPGWYDLLNADTDVVAEIIWGGGLGRIKAQRIKQTLDDIVRRRGNLELDFLSQLNRHVAEEWLLELPGVGLKTARCVLLFSLGIPALPVDTHILRVSKRLGLIDAAASLEEAHHRLEKIVPPEDVYHFHVLTIEHGRKTCRARYPDCLNCTLKEVCISYSP